ncbi:MAG: GNAT family N-acetyltransferase [Clostridia bacterium]|nr:GNAT family N-acetyltransferase [Clostridia bacterium]
MLEFHKMTEEEKSAACSWRYAGEYALYNMPPYEEDLRARSGFASLDFVGFGFCDAGRFIGFTTLYEEADEVMLGIGVAPECCGQGYGREMIRQTCALSESFYPSKRLYLEVRVWNRQAIRCYEHAGFAADGEPFRHTTGLGEGIFQRMVRR